MSFLLVTADLGVIDTTTFEVPPVHWIISLLLNDVLHYLVGTELGRVVSAISAISARIIQHNLITAILKLICARKITTVDTSAVIVATLRKYTAQLRLLFHKVFIHFFYLLYPPLGIFGLHATNTLASPASRPHFLTAVSTE